MPIATTTARDTTCRFRPSRPWRSDLEMPLAPPPPQHIPGRLRRLGPLSNSDALLEPMADDELACWENGFSCRSIRSDERVGGLPARQPRAAGVVVRS
jgi:hypothetical protein